MRLNANSLIFSVLSWIPILLLQTGCTQGNSGDTTTDIAVQPVPIGGKNIANFDNARISCGFTGDAGRYRVDCRLTAIDASGSEQTVDEVVPGLEINWQDPKLLSGPELAGLSCEVARSQLSQSCEVILDASQMAKLQFSNLIRDTLSERSREETDIVTLPLEITTYGLTPEMGRRFSEISVDAAVGAVEKVGFQTVEIPANSQDFKVSNFCLQGEDIYFASGITIFRAQKIKETGEYSVTLWAGSTAVSNVNNFSHRLRVHMGVLSKDLFGTQQPVQISCAADSLLVRDLNNARILRMRPQGSVEKIAGFGNEVLEEGAVAEKVSLNSNIPIGGVYLTASGEVHFDHRGRLYRIRGGKIQRIACSDVALSDPTVGSPLKNLGCAVTTKFAVRGDGRVYVLAQVGSLSSGDLNVYLIGANSNGVIDEVRNLPANIDRVTAVGERILVGNRYQILAFIGDELQTLAGIPSLEGVVSEGSFTTPQALIATTAMESKGKLWIATREQIITVTPNMLSPFRVDVWVGLKKEVPHIFPKEVSAGMAILPTINTIEIAQDGAVYYLDEQGANVGRIGLNHQVRTVAGTGKIPVESNESGSLAVETDFHSIQNMVMAPDGDLWLFEAVPNQGIRIRIVSHETQLVSTSTFTFYGDVMKFGPDGKLYASDFASLRRLDPATGNIEVILDGNTMIPLASGEEQTAGWIRGFAFGDSEEIFFSEARYGRICRTYLDDEGVRRFETIAGNGTFGYSGDGGLALNAQLHFPKSLSRDKSGNIYMVEGDFLTRSESRLRVLRPTAQGYTIETLFGGNLAESADCGSGSIKKDVGAGEVSASLKTTLGSVCPGLMFDVNVRDRCEAEGRKTLIFAQRFASESSQSTLIRVEQPCE